MIFDYYMAGASLGKIVDMLYSKHILSPTGKAKWTRAAVDHIFSNCKYAAILVFDFFVAVQFEKAARCNVDYDQVGTPRKSIRYVSPSMIQIQYSLMKNSIELLASNLYEEFYIEPVTILEEEFPKRSIKQGKIKRLADLFFRAA